MKVLILGISLLAITSCTKDWECCTDATTVHTDSSLIQLNGTNTNCIDFRGTNDEKDDYEADGTRIYNIGYGGTVDLVTTCSPD